MSKKYVVYKHTCPHGKSYIGITANYEKRCYQHQHSKICRAFRDAIIFFGWDNISHEILKQNLSKKLARKYEIYFIAKYNSLFPNGYNLHLTGEKRPVYKSKTENNSEQLQLLCYTKNNIDKIFEFTFPFKELTKGRLKEIFGSIKNAVAISNKYRNEPISHRIFEGLGIDDPLPEERAAFFVTVMLYESMPVKLLRPRTTV